MIALLAIVAVGTIVVVIVRGIARAKSVARIRSTITTRYGVAPLYVSAVDGSAVALDIRRGRIILGAHGHYLAYAFAQIVDVAIVEDGVAISRVNRGSQIARAAVGGAVFGGAGALAGGLSASQTIHQRVRRLAVNITIADRQPLHVVTLLAAGERGAEPGQADGARRSAESILASVRSAMHQAGQHPAELEASEQWGSRPVLPATATPRSVALPPPPPADAFAVVVQYVGSNSDKIVRLLRRHAHEADAEVACDLVLCNIMPATLMVSPDRKRADRFQGALAALGATVTVEKRAGAMTTGDGRPRTALDRLRDHLTTR